MSRHLLYQVVCQEKHSVVASKQSFIINICAKMFGHVLQTAELEKPVLIPQNLLPKVHLQKGTSLTLPRPGHWLCDL